MRNNINISFAGKLNVFTVNPQTRRIESRIIDTSSIRDIKSSKIGGEVVNTLCYRTNKGIASCSSIELGNNYSFNSFIKYFKE